MKDNLFPPGDHCPEEAVTFAPNGHDLVFTGNTFQRSGERVGKPVLLVVDPTCTRGTIEGNLDAKTVKKRFDFNHRRR